MRIEHFLSLPRGPIVLAEVSDGAKRVHTEHRPPTPEDLEAHLAGRAALGLVPDQALSLDFDHHEPEALEPLFQLFDKLRLNFYFGPGTTRGTRIWFFLKAPTKDLNELATKLGNLVHGLGYVPVEVFPKGQKPVILPLFAALGKEPRWLLYSENRREVMPPFEPEAVDPEAFQRVLLAGELLVTALSQRPPSRHDTLLAFLNLAERTGVLEEAAILFAQETLWRAWGMAEDGSRSLEAWEKEVERAKEAARSTDYQHKRGINYLLEAGYPLNRLRGESLHFLYPKPKSLESLISPLPQWPSGMLPDPLEDLMSRLAQHLGIEPTPVGMAVIAGISGLASHKKVRIQPEPENAAWQETSNIWVVIIAPPGVGKSPLLSNVTAPLWRIEQELAQKNRERRKAFERDLLAWKALKADERAEVDQPELPSEHRFVVADATPERLASLLATNSGLLVILDELKGLLASWRREERAQGRALFLSAYSGEPAVVDRVMRGTEYLEQPVLALLAATTPSTWYKLVKETYPLGKEADGLLQRIVPVVAELLPYQENRPELSLEVLEGYMGFFWKLWSTNEYTNFLFQLTPEALRLWRDWRADLEEEIRNLHLPEAWRSLLAKWKGLTARLSGLLAFAHGEKSISERSLAHAIVLLKEILEPHARRAWKAQDQDLSPAFRLAVYLLRNNQDRFSLRDVYRNEWGGLGEKKEAERAVEILVRAGWLIEVFEGRWRRFVLNPRVKEVYRAED